MIDPGAIPLVPAESSNVASYGYDEDSRQLVVKFKSGGLYVYREVEKQVFSDLGQVERRLRGIEISRALQSDKAQSGREVSHRNGRPPGPAEFDRHCRGKHGYATKRLAEGILRVMKRNHGANAATLHSYRCPACHKWHLGNNRSSR